MQKHQLYINLLTLTSALALSACVEEVVYVVNPDVPEVGEKTPIELSACYSSTNDPSSLTRAVITDGAGKTLKSFEKGTSLYMLMKSEHNVAQNPGDPKVTRTIMFAIPPADGSSAASSVVNYSGSLSNPQANEYAKFVRFWDDSYAREAAISILAVCTPGMAPDYAGGYSDNKTWKIGGSDAGYVNRPWDPIEGGGATPYETIKWPVGNNENLAQDQNGTFNGVSFITYEDLCYSNNLGKFTTPSHDERLKFDSGNKKFSSGVLKFYHALSKLTFRFIKGEGFTDEQFTFKENTNVKLSNFNYKGTFNILNGEFITSPSTPVSAGDISRIHLRTDAELTSAEKSNYKYILDALVIPGTDLNTTDDAVTFIINNNEYKLTRKQLFEKFNSTQQPDFFDGNKLKAGVHYIFTFNVGKTKIDKVTASIVPWEEVVADNLDPSNARVTLNLEERNNADNSNLLGSGDEFSIYKASDNIPDASAISDDYATYNWKTGYSNVGANLTWSADHWKTDWYWDSNKNFYHIRALCEDNGSTKVAAPDITTDTGGDYLALTHKETSYKDILWGAPMLDYAQNEVNDYVNLKWNYGPTMNGFDGKDNIDFTQVANADKHQIYKAIGPTVSQIKLILFHMMSDVTFKVKTTAADQPDKVNLGDGTGTNVTKIELQKIHTSGKLFLGNGLVQGSTDNVESSNFLFTQTPAPDASGVITWANYGAIPQDLTDVVLVITTPDNNQYKVALTDVLTTTIPSVNIANPYGHIVEVNSVNKFVIDRWYPGFKYVYTFTLKKKGIADISATVVNWETVETDNEEVTIQ